MAEESWTWAQPGNKTWGTVGGTQAGSGNADSPQLYTLDESTAAHAYKVAGASRYYKFTGGKAGDTLLLDHSGGDGNSIDLTFENLNVSDMWLYNAGGGTNKNNYYVIVSQDSLSALSELQNLYINKTALQIKSKESTQIQLTVSDWKANLILGALPSSVFAGAGAISNGAPAVDTDAAGATLYLSMADITTSGYLEATENVKIFMEWAGTRLSVSELRGSGDLEWCTKATNPGASLQLRQGGESYSGRLISSGNQKLKIQLGEETRENVNLNVSGLGGDVGFSFQALCTGDATITITGSDATANVASGIELGERVTLKLADNAVQSLSAFSGDALSKLALGNGSTLSLLDGAQNFAGALSVAAGEARINLNALSAGESLFGLSALDIQGGAKLTIHLADLTVYNFASVDLEHLVFSNWDDLKASIAGYLDADQLVFSNNQFGRKTLKLDAETGKFFFDGEDAKDLTWNGTSDNVWFDAAVETGRPDDQFWTSPAAETFYNLDSVTFDGGDGTVSISGNIVVNNVTALEDWTISATNSDQDTLSVIGAVNVAEGKTLTLSNLVYDAESLTHSGASEGSLTLSGVSFRQSAVTIGGAVTLDNVTLSTGGTLSLAANAAVSLRAANGSSYNGALSVGDDATLTLNGDISINGWGRIGVNSTIDGTATLTLNNAGDASNADGSLTIGEGITVNKTGAGEFRFVSGGTETVGQGIITINGALNVNGGTLRFNGGASLNGAVNIASGAKLVFWKKPGLTREINGELSGAGGISTITEELAINGGGTLTGLLEIGHAGIVTLGKDLTVGGLAHGGGDVTGIIQRGADVEDEVTLTVNVAANTTQSINAALQEGVKLKKTGAGTQTLSAGSTVDGSLELQEGTLDISAMTQKTIGGNLTISGGTFNWGTGALTVLGETSLGSGVSFAVNDNDTVNFVTLAAGSEGSITVAESGTLIITDANGGKVSNLTLNGNFSLGGGTLNVGTLEAASTGSMTVELERAAKLIVGALGTGLTGGGDDGKLDIHVSASDVVLNLQEAYQLFAEGGWTSDWKSYFNLVIDGDTSEKLSVELNENGQLVFSVDAQNLLWDTVGGNWTAENAWKDLDNESAPATFQEYAVVTFDHETGGDMLVSGDQEVTGMVVKNGDWRFISGTDGDAGSMVIGGGVAVQNGSATFELSRLELGGILRGTIGIAGAGSVEGEGITVADAAELTISTSGAKNFGGINVAAGGTVVITQASNWNGAGAKNKITGDGTLVLKNLTMGVDNANTEWANFQAMMQSVLDNTGTDNSRTTHLARLDLKDTAIKITGQTETNSLQSYIRSAKEVHITDGSSIGINGAMFNNSGGGRTLYLAGSGMNGEGALYLTATTERTANWDIALEDHATIVLPGRLEFVSGYNGNGKTLTKRGSAELQLNSNFSTEAGSSGTFEVQEGTLRFGFANNISTALANYDIKLSGGTLNVNNADYTIHSLSGTSATSSVTGNNARTLTICNTDSAATENNTYAGGVTANVALCVTGGYQKLTGNLVDGLALSAVGSSAAETGTLALAGTLAGTSEVSVGDYGVLDFAGLQRAEQSQLRVLASGTYGALANLVLKAGDTLGFADAPTANGSDPGVEVELRGRIALEGGSSLLFGVQHADASDAWGTATRLVLGSGATLDLSAASANNKIVLDINPYGRTSNDELVTLAEGSRHLIIAGAGLPNELLTLLQTPKLEGRMRYKLDLVTSGDAPGLYLYVEEAAGILTWGVAAGGEWNSTSWYLADAPADFLDFRTGDAVIFDSLETEDVVTISIPTEGVSVGGITVKGDTSYTLQGNISGEADLVVGTQDEAFTGVLTLTGANSWTKGGTLNSGTVVAENASALGSGETTVNSGAELRLNYAGAATLSSALALEGGVLTAQQDAAVSASLNGASLQAAAQKSLSVQLTNTSLGAVQVNAGTATGMTGSVTLAAESAAQVSATSLNVAKGRLLLDKQSTAADFKVTGNVDVATGSTLEVASGVSLSGYLHNTAGDLLLQSGSSLSATGSAAKITSNGALLTGANLAQVTGTLTLASGTTTLAGGWDVAAVTATQGSLEVASGADVTLRQAALDSVVAHGSLNVKTGVEISRLQMDGGTLGGADDKAHTLAADQVSLSGTAQVSEKLTLELSGAGSTISGGGVSAAGEIHVDLADTAQPALSISDDAQVSGAVRIDSGLVQVQSTGVTGSFTLNGASAILDLTATALSMDISMQGGGTLQNSSAYTGVITLHDGDSTPGVAFDLGGLSDDAQLTIQSLHGGNSVSGLANLTLTGASTLYLNRLVQVDEENPVTPLFSFSGAGELTAQDGATLLINVSSVLGDVLNAGADGVSYQLSDKSISTWRSALTFDASSVVLGWEVSFVEAGQLHLVSSGTAERSIYQSTEQQGGSDSWAQSSNDRDIYESVGSWGAIVVDKQTEIDLSGTTPTGIYKDTGLLLHNVMGTDNGVLHIQGDGKSKVTFQNDVSEAELENFRDMMGDAAHLVQNSLTYAGSITIDNADMEVHHVDGMYSTTPSVNSTTSVLGDVTLTNGNLSMVSGRLELAGMGNEFGRDVTFYSYQGQVGISGKAVVRGQISVDDSLVDPVGEERAHVLLTDGGELALDGGAGVGAGVIIGSDALADAPQVAGTLSIGESRQSRSASVDAATGLRHVVLAVNGSLNIVGAEPVLYRAADQAPSSWCLAGLTGEGSVATTDAKNIDFLVGGEDRYFYGDLSAYSGTMRIGASPLTQHFNGVTGGKGWNVLNEAGGHVSFNLVEHNGGNNLTMGSLELQAGSFTTVLFDLERLNGSNGMHLSSLNIEDKADVTIGQYEGTVWLTGEDGEVFDFVLGGLDVADGGEKNIGDDVQWHLKGVRNAGEFYVWEDADGTLHGSVTQDNTNIYARYADNVNSAAGAELLWGKHEGKTLQAVDNVVYALLGEDAPKSRADVAEANRVLAAVAGASTAVLGQAVSADLERQMRNVRNRTTTMTPAGNDAPESAVTSTWLRAENSYYKQDAEGMLPGFKTTGWGGSVGVDVTMGSASVVGLAISAMYNDITGEGPDSLKGNMDTFYVSAFAQFSQGSWKHTLIGTVGRADIKVDRTVNYGLGSYTTKGDTDALGFGLMYELGYSSVLDAESGTCLQAVFNAAWRNSRVDSYTETGSDAALRVDGQNHNAVTLGMGARLQTPVGSQLWNHIGIFEARALVKAELADRRSVASVALQEAAAKSAKVKSSEKGVVGLELGAGLTLPTGNSSDIFVDFSMEVWKNLVEMNAGVGYKMSF